MKTRNLTMCAHLSAKIKPKQTNLGLFLQHVDHQKLKTQLVCMYFSWQAAPVKSIAKECERLGAIHTDFPASRCTYSLDMPQVQRVSGCEHLLLCLSILPLGREMSLLFLEWRLSYSAPNRCEAFCISKITESLLGNVFHSHRLTVQLTVHSNIVFNNVTLKATLERSCSFQGQK